MFREHRPSTSPTLFGGLGQVLPPSKAKALSDPNAWFNRFRDEVTARLDERPFAVLYEAGQGRPNAPVRLLLAMMVLKEGFGWSDAELFEACQLDLRVMTALGQVDLEEESPVASTYYLFRKAVYKHAVTTGDDLIAQAFESLTQSQAKAYQVDGRQIRLDSKLINSNIALATRLELILSVVQAFWREVPEAGRALMGDEPVLALLLEQRPGQLTYRMSAEEKKALLVDLGRVTHALLARYADQDIARYAILARMYREQYHEEEMQPRDRGDIDADSLQSVHDEEAAYRHKGDQKVRGFSMNVTETCADEGLRLVVAVAVEPATESDADFVEEALAAAERVVGPLEQATMDGAYQRPSNREQGDVRMVFTGMQGQAGAYRYEQVEGSWWAIHRQSGDRFMMMPYKPERFKFIDATGRRVYVKAEAIASDAQRQRVEQLTEQERNRRNNVEATIYAMSYPLRKDKTRYRGLLKHRWWARFRAMWVNLRRIAKFLGGEDAKTRLGGAIGPRNGLGRAWAAIIGACFDLWLHPDKLGRRRTYQLAHYPDHYLGG